MAINFGIPPFVKYSKCSYVLYVLFTSMPHTCVIIELDHIFILKYIYMTKSDNCVFEMARLMSAV